MRPSLQPQFLFFSELNGGGSDFRRRAVVEAKTAWPEQATVSTADLLRVTSSREHSSADSHSPAQMP